MAARSGRSSAYERRPQGNDLEITRAAMIDGGLLAILAGKTGVEIRWEKRSLQDFETFRWRPWQGTMTDRHRPSACGADHRRELPAAPGRAGPRGGAAGALGGKRRPVLSELRVERTAMGLSDRRGDPGAGLAAGSHGSLQTWRDMLALARSGRRPPAAQAAAFADDFYTLCGNLGPSCRSAGKGSRRRRNRRHGGRAVQEISALIDPACFGMDPIAVLEVMAAEPRPPSARRLSTAMSAIPLPAFARRSSASAISRPSAPPGRSARRSAGRHAVSAFSQAPPEQAIDFAYWLAGGGCSAPLCGIRRPARPRGRLAGRYGQ